MVTKSKYATILIVALVVSLLGGPLSLASGPAGDMSLHFPATVQAAASRIIGKGVSERELQDLLQKLVVARFSETDLLDAEKIIIEAQADDLPVRPIVNKALEGAAKNISPARIIGAMDTVRSRYLRSYTQARSLPLNRESQRRLGDLLAESLAAGLKEEETTRILNGVKARADSSEANTSTSCLSFVRDMARMGVGSEVSVEIAVSALASGMSAAQIEAMHASFLSESQGQPAQAAALGIAHGMQHGQTSQGQHGQSSSGSSGAGSGSPGGSGSGPGGGGAGGGPGGGGPGGGGGAGGAGGGGGGGGSGGGPGK
jgi:hypothetical protein